MQISPQFGCMAPRFGIDTVDPELGYSPNPPYTRDYWTRTIGHDADGTPTPNPNYDPKRAQERRNEELRAWCC